MPTQPPTLSLKSCNDYIYVFSHCVSRKWYLH